MGFGQIRNLILKCALLPMMMAPAEGGGGGGGGETTTEEATTTELPETVVSEIPKPADMDDAEWESLTEAERESLHITQEEIDREDGGLSEEELAAIAEEETETGTEGTETGEVTDDTETAAPGADDLPTDEQLLAFRPTVADSELKFSNEVPAEIQTKFDELEAKFEDGDISPKEYREQTNALNREVMQAQIIQRDNSREELVWKREQAQFLNSRPDYAELADGKLTERAEMLYGALSKKVETLLKQPGAENKTGMQILVEADRAVRKTFNLPFPSKKAAAAPAKEEKPAEPAKSIPPAARPRVKTLASTPEAAPTEGNPYAHIMKLKGQDYENALASMSEKQVDAFLKYSGGQ